MAKRVNWHLGLSRAIENDLRDYAGILSFEMERPLGNYYYRIDLLVVRRLSDRPITKALASDFRRINLFELKGAGASLTVRSYYRLIGCAGLLIDELWPENRYHRAHFTLHLMSLRRPEKLFRHLKLSCRLIEKTAPGIYNVGGETFVTHIIVTSELSADDYLYLRCMTNNLKPSDRAMVSRMAKDYEVHRNQQSYEDYMTQFTQIFKERTGGRPMICEGIFELFGTSSEEIREKQHQEDMKQIEQANARADHAIARANAQADRAVARADLASARADHFRQMLLAHGIEPTEP